MKLWFQVYNVIIWCILQNGHYNKSGEHLLLEIVTIFFLWWEIFSRSLSSVQRRRQWHPTPVLLPGKSQGWRSLVGCSPWDRDWATSLSLFTLMHWRSKWQPTPVFLPGESQGQGSLVGCRLWGRIEWLKRLSSSRQHIKKQRHYFVNKGPSSQGHGFSSGHVWIWELDYKKSWV